MRAARVSQSCWVHVTYWLLSRGIRVVHWAEQTCGHARNTVASWEVNDTDHLTKKRLWPNDGLMLAHHPQRWPNIRPALCWSILLFEKPPYNQRFLIVQYLAAVLLNRLLPFFVIWSWNRKRDFQIQMTKNILEFDWQIRHTYICHSFIYRIILSWRIRCVTLISLTLPHICHWNEWNMWRLWAIFSCLSYSTLCLLWAIFSWMRYVQYNSIIV